MNKIISKHYWIFLILSIFFCVTLSIILFCTRNQFHVDEVWSYTLSNKHDSPFLYAHTSGIGEELDDINDFVVEETNSYREYFNHWHDGDYYKKALTVQNDERFNYGRVYYNQTLDIHPPLYYFILHTVSSFFPNKFSWWFAFGINIVFYIGTMVMIFIIARKLGLSVTNSLLAVLLWGLSILGTGEVCFLRMYMMLTFFMMCVTYLCISLISNFNIKCVVAIFILNILAFLTQYYSYVYVFFLTLFYLIYLICNREYKQCFLYAFIVLLSVAIAISLFPAIFKHVFSSVYTSVLKKGVASLSAILFGYLLTFLICIIILLVIFKLIKNLKKNKNLNIKKYFNKIKNLIKDFFISGEKEKISCKIVIFSLLFTSIVILFVSPDMGTKGIRYFFLVLPLFSILIVNYMDKLLAYCLRNSKKNIHLKEIILFLLCIIIIGGSYSFYELHWLFYNINNKDGSFESYFENSRIIVVDGTHHTQALTPLLMNSIGVYPVDTIDNHLDDILINCKDNASPVYLIVSSFSISKEQVDNYLSEKESYNYSYIGEYYCSSDDPSYYYFYRIEI